MGAAGRKTLETVTAADDIVEALDLAADEDERMREFEEVSVGVGVVVLVGEGWGAGCGGWWGGGCVGWPVRVGAGHTAQLQRDLSVPGAA